MSGYAFSNQQDADLDREIARAAEAPSGAKGSVRFYMGARINEAKSEEEGRPVYEDVPFIRIHTPGDATTIYDQPANLDAKNPHSHVRRFPTEWKAFREAGKVPETGTPLSEVTFLPRSQVEELGYRGIKTVEQLAEVADQFVGQMANGHALKSRAQKYLDNAKAAAGANTLAKERAELEAMKAQLAQLIEAQSAKSEAKQTSQKK